MPSALVEVDAAYPYVAAETDEGPVLLLDSEALEAGDGDPEALVAAVEAAVTEHGLAWPGPASG